MIWIVGSAAIAFVNLFAYSMCRAIKIADLYAERLEAKEKKE